MRKVSIIMVEPERLAGLMAATGKSRSAVYMALRYATNGPDPDLIRKKAVEEFGGVKVQKIIH